jgi:hypothetical protein
MATTETAWTVTRQWRETGAGQQYTDSRVRLNRVDCVRALRSTLNERAPCPLCKSLRLGSITTQRLVDRQSAFAVY